MTHLVCLGLGYCARALAARLRAGAARPRITGTATSEAGVAALRRDGFDAVLFDGKAPSPALAAALASATHVLASIPPGQAGDPALVHHAGDLAAAPGLVWAGYLSTIGVYGDHGGAWIDETTPATPISARGQRRVEAEAAWQRLLGERVQVFRLPGIYGPGRSAIEQVLEGGARAIVKPGQVFNRIHVADIAAVLAAAMSGRGRHRIYNVVDDEPAPPQDVLGHAATLIGRPPPPAVPIAEAGLSAMGASFYAECKRCRNARIKDDLGVRLAYPTYREGLAAIAGAR
jgi:nucleoside-diphosphate-sugar epimerase